MFGNIKREAETSLYRTDYIVMNRVEDEKMASMGIKVYKATSFFGVEVVGFNTYSHGIMDFRDLEAGYFFLEVPHVERTAVFFLSESGLVYLSDAQHQAIGDYASKEIHGDRTRLVVDGKVVLPEFSPKKFDEVRELVKNFREQKLNSEYAYLL